MASAPTIVALEGHPIGMCSVPADFSQIVVTVASPDGTIVNGLEAVMSIWTERNVEITGARNIRHSITALVMLLKSGHSKLNEIMVSVAHTSP